MSNAFLPLPKLWLSVAGLSLGWSTTALAFPPAPYYTIFGTVRDEVGTALNALDASVVLLKGNEVVLRSPVSVGISINQNYELRIPIDMLRSATTLYRDEAIVARNGFVIGVEMNGQRFYPVGVASSLTAGGGSERERFDFTLGVDSDGDGLPDAWEEWQLSIGGPPPGPNGYDLTLLTRDGDLDKDGVTNYDEYIQGTYASDGSSQLFLQFKENRPDRTVLEFGTVAGRFYQLEQSDNLITWSLVPFSVGVPGFPNETFFAAVTENVTAHVIPGPERRVFYRLTIK